jgi:hypothetical protein
VICNIIDDLKGSISSMSEDKLMELMMEIRANRRVRKSKPQKGKKSNVLDLEKLLGNLSPEVAKSLLEKIKEKK